MDNHDYAAEDRPPSQLSMRMRADPDQMIASDLPKKTYQAHPTDDKGFPNARVRGQALMPGSLARGLASSVLSRRSPS